MKNKRGQALVEFVMILPVLLVLVFCVVDFGRVISLKNELENKVSDVVTFYEAGSDISEIRSKISQSDDKIIVDISTNGEYATINLSKKINPITPGLNRIRNDVFNVKATRVIKNE